MPSPPILPDDEPVSLPSEPTMRAGGASRPGEPLLGRIDHYDLLRKLGGGGFGVVYLARDTVSGVEVALKTLHPLVKRNAEEMDLLRGKFRLVSRLTHTNIAKALVIHLVRKINVWDAAARAELKLSSGDSVMVMDYAPGVTLSKWRRQFPDGIVPFDLALEIGRQVAAALDYAHSERIVHRDIKPGNIMVETLGGASSPSEPQGPGAAARRDALPHRLRVRILDFGLAAEIRSSMSRVSTEVGDTSGTRPYMAPEQWLGKKQDSRTDQYALACVLYELLSGAPPFAAVFETGDPAVMLAAVKSEEPAAIDALPAAANAALVRALAKDPAVRFPSCTAFVEEVGRALRASRGGSAGRPLRSARAPLLRRLAVALAVSVAIALGLHAWVLQDLPPVDNAEKTDGWVASLPDGAVSDKTEEVYLSGIGTTVTNGLAGIASVEPFRADATGVFRSWFEELDAVGTRLEGCLGDASRYGEAKECRETVRGLVTRITVNAAPFQEVRGIESVWTDWQERLDEWNVARLAATDAEEVLSLQKRFSGLTRNGDYAEAVLTGTALTNAADKAVRTARGAQADALLAEAQKNREDAVLALGFVSKALEADPGSEEAKSFQKELEGRIGRDKAEIINLKNQVTGAGQAVSRWRPEPAFAAHFLSFDQGRNALERTSDDDAAALASVRQNATNALAQAAWIRENGTALETFREAETTVTNVLSRLDGAEVVRFAAQDRDAAAAAWLTARREFETGSFVPAATAATNAVALYRRTVQGIADGKKSVRIGELLAAAEAAAAEKDWAGCSEKAGEILDLDGSHVRAKELCGLASRENKAARAVYNELVKAVRDRQSKAKAADAKRRAPKAWKGAEDRVRTANERKAAGNYALALAELQEATNLYARAEAEARRRIGKDANVTLDLGSGISLEMVACSGVAPDFWMGKFEVTQEQWKQVMGTTPSHYKNKPKNPVESVSWNDCQEFVRKLNALPTVKESGLTFRLPTEEEWEPACRAGAPKSEDYCKLADGTQITKSNLSRVAWFGKGWDDGPAEVGKNREPNAWGLYDMHGNVLEWTQTADGDYRVCRGGGFFGSAGYCGAGYRGGNAPDDRGELLGFRLAASGRTAAAPAKPEATARTSDGKQAARSAAASRSESHKPGERKVVLVDDVELALRWCPPGSFLMGSPTSEGDRFDNETQHRVTLTTGFWMGETEVTQGLWKKVMGGNNPSRFQSGDEYPVEFVSWDDCQDFLRNLNLRSPVAGFEWRLPTEAQWEYACRAGSSGAFAGTGRLDDMGWYDGNSGSRTHPVAGKKANAWGLYDMHGNVWEWCADWYGLYPSGTVTDPAGPSSGSNRVYRGGSWDDDARFCRSAIRNYDGPSLCFILLGFRVALVPVQ